MEPSDGHEHCGPWQGHCQREECGRDRVPGEDRSPRPWPPASADHRACDTSSPQPALACGGMHARQTPARKAAIASRTIGIRERIAMNLPPNGLHRYPRPASRLGQDILSFQAAWQEANIEPRRGTRDRFQTKKRTQRPARPSSANNIATVMLRGQWVILGDSPRLSMRKTRH